MVVEARFAERRAVGADEGEGCRAGRAADRALISR